MFVKTDTVDECAVGAFQILDKIIEMVIQIGAFFASKLCMARADGSVIQLYVIAFFAPSCTRMSFAILLHLSSCFVELQFGPRHFDDIAALEGLALRADGLIIQAWWIILFTHAAHWHEEKITAAFGDDRYLDPR